MYRPHDVEDTEQHLCGLDPKVKVIGQKAGICDGVLSTSALVSINFVNVLSYYRCIRYLVFPALFPSISMVVIDYMCIKSVTDYSKSVRLLLK